MKTIVMHGLGTLISIVGLMLGSASSAQNDSSVMDTSSNRVIAEELNLLASAAESSLTTCLDQLNMTSEDPIERHTRMAEVYSRLATNQCRNRLAIIQEVRRLRLNLQTVARSRFGDETTDYEYPIQQLPRPEGPAPTHFFIWQILIEELASEGADSARSLELLRIANHCFVLGHPIGFWSVSGESALKSLSSGVSYAPDARESVAGNIWNFRHGMRTIRNKTTFWGDLNSQGQLDSRRRSETRVRAHRLAEAIVLHPRSTIDSINGRSLSVVVPPIFLRNHPSMPILDLEAFVYLRELTGNGSVQSGESRQGVGPTPITDRKSAITDFSIGASQ